jgi:hypothetical protein
MIEGNASSKSTTERLHCFASQSMVRPSSPEQVLPPIIRAPLMYLQKIESVITSADSRSEPFHHAPRMQRDNCCMPHTDFQLRPEEGAAQAPPIALGGCQSYRSNSMKDDVSAGVPATQCCGAGENVGHDVGFDDLRKVFVVVIGIGEDYLEEDFGLELRREAFERHCVVWSGWLVAGIDSKKELVF